MLRFFVLFSIRRYYIQNIYIDKNIELKMDFTVLQTVGSHKHLGQKRKRKRKKQMEQPSIDVIILRTSNKGLDRGKTQRMQME